MGKKHRTRKRKRKRTGGREGSVTELLVSQTPMGMSGGGKGAGLSPYIQRSHEKLEESIRQSCVLCSNNPKQSRIRLGTI